MKFSVLTLFPDMFSPLKQSIIGKAIEDKKIELNLINIRDFSKDKHKKVDDTPYGGGAGMVMKADVVYDAYEHIKDEKAKVIFLSPQGKTLNQNKVKELATEEHIILLCGHYEGIDQRVIDEIVDEEISIGDYVLTGGELPAMVLIDSVSRYVEGVLSKDSIKEESFTNNLLEYPQYTRPEIFHGIKVPEVLLSGHHENIKKWREEQSLKNTLQKKTKFIKKKGGYSIMDIIKSIEHEQLKDKIPDLKVGDTVRVHQKIKEGNRERIQVFEGIIIKKQGGGLNATFTVRKIAYGVGVEKTFLIHSPLVEKVEVVRVGKARRAKLYYLRDRIGKAAKTKEDIGARIETNEISVKETVEAPVSEEVATPVEDSKEEAPAVKEETPVVEEVVDTVKEEKVETVKETSEEKESK